MCRAHWICICKWVHSRLGGFLHTRKLESQWGFYLAVVSKWIGGYQLSLFDTELAFYGGKITRAWQ